MANARVYRDTAYTSRSRSSIASNSVAIANGDFLSLSGGFLIKATTSSKIEGMANGTKTYDADNQTVDMERASYTKAGPMTEFEIVITGGTVTQADEGVSYYNLTTLNRIDGTTESAIESYVDTVAASATDAVINMQFKLVKYLSATLGIFVAVQ